MDLYRDKSSDPKTDAQRNLRGRTHYVEDDTLRFHKSRVISARTTNDGLLFAIVTSDALDMHNTKRGFRYVIFDLFGTVVARTDLEQTYRKSDKCTKAMWAELNAIDAKAVTLAAIEKAGHDYAAEMGELRREVERVTATEKAA